MTATLLKTDCGTSAGSPRKLRTWPWQKATTRKLLHGTTRAASVLRTQVDIVRRQLIQPRGSLAGNRIYSTNILGWATTKILSLNTLRSSGMLPMFLIASDSFGKRNDRSRQAPVSAKESVGAWRCQGVNQHSFSWQVEVFHLKEGHRRSRKCSCPFCHIL